MKKSDGYLLERVSHYWILPYLNEITRIILISKLWEYSSFTFKKLYDAYVCTHICMFMCECSHMYATVHV